MANYRENSYVMFSWYKYLIVNLVFSHLGFWSGNLFLIAPFPDLCILVLFHLQSSPLTLRTWHADQISNNIGLPVLFSRLLHHQECARLI